MLQTILTRRSIRKFKNTHVSDKDIEDLLKAAMAAPSAGNSLCWEFFVINKREILDEIPKIHPFAQMTLEAPLAILVCADLTREKYKGRWMLDCSAASQNILLAAHTKGLGAVWVGIYPEEVRMNGMIKLLNLPENIKPVSLIPIGYPNEHKPVSDRFDKNKIHFNKYK
jgi:nitroreductase